MNKRFMKIFFAGVVLSGVSSPGLACAPSEASDSIGSELEREYMCRADDDCYFVTSDFQQLLAHEQSH